LNHLDVEFSPCTRCDEDFPDDLVQAFLLSVKMCCSHLRTFKFQVDKMDQTMVLLLNDIVVHFMSLHHLEIHLTPRLDYETLFRLLQVGALAELTFHDPYDVLHAPDAKKTNYQLLVEQGQMPSGGIQGRADQLLCTTYSALTLAKTRLGEALMVRMYAGTVTRTILDSLLMHTTLNDVDLTCSDWKRAMIRTACRIPTRKLTLRCNNPTGLSHSKPDWSIFPVAGNAHSLLRDLTLREWSCGLHAMHSMSDTVKTISFVYCSITSLPQRDRQPRGRTYRLKDCWVLKQKNWTNTQFMF
jgi:hypothetical protein